MKAQTKDALRLRTLPLLTADIIRTMKSGEIVDVTMDCEALAGGLSWWIVTDAAGNKGWAANKWLGWIDVEPPPVPPPGKRPYKGKSIGLHIAGSGQSTSFVGIAKRLHEAGKPIPAMLIVSDPGLCKTIKDVSPDTMVIYRWVAGADDASPFANLRADGSGSTADGRAWVDQLWTRHSQAIGADYHQLYNEVAFGGNGQSVRYAEKFAAFNIDMMKRAREMGIHVTVGNFFPGVPEDRHIAVMQEMFAMAEQYDMPLIYHNYTSDANNPATGLTDYHYQSEAFALRWVKWLKPFPKLKMIGGETARYHAPRFQGREDTLRLMKDLDSLNQPLLDAGIDVRECFWTLRGELDPMWRHDDFEPALGDYEAWMKS